MKNLFRLSTIIIASSFASNALANFSLNGSATGRIMAALSIQETTSLNFGTFASGATSGTIKAQDGTTTGGVVKYNFGGNRTAAVFTVIGDNNGTNIPYTFTIPTSSPYITLTSSGGQTMTVTSLTFASGTTSRTIQSSLGGQDVVTLNATLTVPASSPAGTYTGTYTVTAAY